MFQDSIAVPGRFVAGTSTQHPPLTQPCTPRHEAHDPSSNHIDKASFKQIFIDRWPDFQRLYPRYNSEYYDEIIQKMLDCGEPEKMGFRQYRCLYCGHTQKVAFSCKGTFCLSCAIPYTDRWVDFISQRLFPGVVYRHIILTMPDFLGTWFYRVRQLIEPFILTGFEFLKKVFRIAARRQLHIGSIIIPQTHGRSGKWNPHLHIIQTAGGIDHKGRWRHQTYIPYDALHHEWKDCLLSMLRGHSLEPKMAADVDKADCKYKNGFVAYLQKGVVPPGGKGLARYLAKYVVSPPIAVRRIEWYDGVNVRYWYRDHLTESIQHETISVVRFIGRMVQHIFQKGFQRIRYYGIHSNRQYKKIREALPELLPKMPPKYIDGTYRVMPPKSFKQRFSESFHKDPFDCPKCGREMELELIWHPRYGVLKSYEHLLYLEVIHDEKTRAPPRRATSLARRTQRMVQIPLPFM